MLLYDLYLIESRSLDMIMLNGSHFIVLPLEGILPLLVFFFSSRRRHTRSKRDWSSTCALRSPCVMCSSPSKGEGRREVFSTTSNKQTKEDKCHVSRDLA